MSAVDALLADPGRCRRFASDVAVHWYRDDDPRCFCGELVRAAEDPAPALPGPALAIHVPCPRCASPAGVRCMSASGKPADFHIARTSALRVAQAAAMVREALGMEA